MKLDCLAGGLCSMAVPLWSPGSLCGEIRAAAVTRWLNKAKLEASRSGCVPSVFRPSVFRPCSLFLFILFFSLFSFSLCLFSTKPGGLLKKQDE